MFLSTLLIVRKKPREGVSPKQEKYVHVYAQVHNLRTTHRFSLERFRAKPAFEKRRQKGVVSNISKQTTKPIYPKSPTDLLTNAPRDRDSTIRSTLRISADHDMVIRDYTYPKNCQKSILIHPIRLIHPYPGRITGQVPSSTTIVHQWKPLQKPNGGDAHKSGPPPTTENDVISEGNYEIIWNYPFWIILEGMPSVDTPDSSVSSIPTTDVRKHLHQTPGGDHILEVSW